MTVHHNKWCESQRVHSYEVSTKDLGNHMAQLCPQYQYHLCPTGSREVGMLYWYILQGYQITLPHTRPCLRQVEPSVGQPPHPTWKRQPGHLHTKWTDQLCCDNNTVPITTLWRQAIDRGHSTATLQSTSTMQLTTTTALHNTTQFQ